MLQDAAVSLSPASLNFSGQQVGTSSASQTVTLTAGFLPITIGGITVNGANAADYTQKNNCGTSLPAAASCTIRVVFKPSAVGVRTASVSITDNATGSPQTIALSGTGVVSGANATLSPTSLTFAAQLVGTTSSPQSITLSNYGTATLNLTSISASGDFTQTNTCGSTLIVLASCTISVSFQPTQGGTRTGAVSIRDNAAGSPQKLSLTGTGTVVKLNPASLTFTCSFRRRTCPPHSQTTTLTNVGSTTLDITSITVSGVFTQTNDCGGSVSAGKSCSITVSFDSEGVGTYTGTVSISDDGGASPQTVALTGTVTFEGRSGSAVSHPSRSTKGPEPVTYFRAR
jgi:hypothetical protein